MSEVQPTVEYREIPEFPGYRVGNDGSVWTLWKRKGIGRPYGTTFILGGTWKKMRPVKTKRGRRQVTLKPGRKSLYVHTLILTVFIGSRPQGMQACHFPDRDQSNNRLTNLRWGTPKDNADDREKHGNTLHGEKNANAKLTSTEIFAIRQETRTRGSGKRLANKFGVSRSLISGIINGKSWKHLKPPAVESC